MHGCAALARHGPAARSESLSGRFILRPAVDTTPDHVSLGAVIGDTDAAPETGLGDPAGAESVRRRRRGLRIPTDHDVLWLLSIYLAIRVVLLLAAYLNGSLNHYNFLHELANWDGLWYRELANHGYPTHPYLTQTTLGFLPLYPIAIWILEPVFTLTGHDSIWSATVSGVVVSGIGGAVATYYVFRLATAWWGREVARRAAVIFILFPGSVVFSMVYSEGLILPLATGCLYALQRKKWLQAGILAGFATAVGPTALVLIGVCAISALLEWRRRGWSTQTLRKVIVAPILSTAGIVIFAIFLWFWTGTPLASYQAQHHGWSEKTSPTALVHLTAKLFRQVSFTSFSQPHVDMNLVVGLIGAILLLGLLVLMYFQRHRISIEAIVWTLGITFLTVTSSYVPPNPRMLITNFPALMVVAPYAKGKWWTALVTILFILLIVLSVMTFHGTTLRP
jgi:Mannosyltransferase (PIG-V)